MVDNCVINAIEFMVVELFGVSNVIKEVIVRVVYPHGKF